MSMVVSHEEEKNRRRGKILSIVIHVTLLIMALLPLMTYQDPPPGQEGILVNLGLPDQGQGDENAGPAEPVQPEEEAQPQPEEPQEEEKPQEVKKPEPVKEKEVVQTEDPEAIALKRKKEQEQKQKEEEARQQREAEAKRKADEAARKAEEDRKRKEAEAKDFGKSLGLEGLGKGKGNTGKSGNQGDPNGDPNASNLEGISKGTGKVGGGLGNRGVVSAPKLTENSQKEGTVVVYVCVDNGGNVTSAKVQQGGTTTVDNNLRTAAVNNAKRWRFSAGGSDEVCGTITYTFKLQ